MIIQLNETSSISLLARSNYTYNLLPREQLQVFSWSRVQEAWTSSLLGWKKFAQLY